MLAKIGYRNLWRNKRRTILTMGAMSGATAMLILILGVYSGMMWDMLSGATENYHGHAKLVLPEYLETRRTELAFAQSDVEESAMAKQSVIGVASRVRIYMLLSRGEGDDAQTQPAELLGVDPGDERTVTTLHEKVVKGSFLSDANADSIVLGKGLAKSLEASLGDEIVVMGQAADGSIAADLLHVKGILDTGDSVRDASLALMGRERLQLMAALQGRIHELVLRIDEPLMAREWVASANLSHEGAKLYPWHEFLPQVAQMLDMWDAMYWIYGVIFYFAVVLICVNTMYMSFFERIREFAVMGAIGLKPKKLARLIFMEGVIMSSISGLVGGLAGFVLSKLLEQNPIDLSSYIGAVSISGTTLQPRIQTYMMPANILIPVGMMIALGLVVAWFPARRLKKLRPVEALREV